MPLVSIIIPTYNRSSFLEDAIASVYRQTFTDYELIVVDDGSTDATGRVLERHAGRLTAIRIAHAGPSAARNAGIAAARGEYIAFLDSDDLWMPGKLKKQIAFFRDRPEARICQTEEIWIRNGVRVNPMKKHKKHSGWIFKECLPLCIVSPSAVMLHRSLFDRAGLFDESMPACEDYDLWLRIAACYPIHLIDRPLIIKRGGHADQQSRTVPVLDRLRIQALAKLLAGGVLSREQHGLALAELEKKCRIYAGGCRKRGRMEEAFTYQSLPARFASAGTDEDS